MAEETKKASSSTSQQSYDHKQSDKTGLKPQGQGSSEFRAHSHGDFPMNPVYYPDLVSSSLAVRGRTDDESWSCSEPSNEAETSRGEGQGQDGQQQPAHQRRVVEWRFEIAFQLDFLLILKLAAVVFLFSQDGSRQRLAVLVFFATILKLFGHLFHGFQESCIEQQHHLVPGMHNQDSSTLCRVLSFSSTSASLHSLADALNVFQVFKKYVEIGRVALVNFGKDYGKLVDQNRALVDALDMERIQMNLKKLSLTDINRVPEKKTLIEAMKKAEGWFGEAGGTCKAQERVHRLMFFI
ncbi:unnamed protein product [Thlaspi arvense]|uniref:Uncharacterized protein n=1 Tax=Thlaspi arvense TaxID=13288 RepID=A0AAU9RSK3_THLAR|nr:unnamed protein product [Thlaspi arvense]